MCANAKRDGRLPNIGGAVCSTPNARVHCSNAAKKRNPVKFVGVAQTPEQISAVSGKKVTIL